MWLYGSGFPKSMAIDKAVESKLINNSANKKDFKNLDGTKVETGNWGISKMSYEQGFRASDYTADKHLRIDKVNYQTEEGKKWQGWGTCLKPAFEPIIVARKPFKGTLVDNIIKYGVGGLNIDECRVGNQKRYNPSATIGKDDIYNWNTTTNKNENYTGQVVNGRFPANLILTYNQLTFDDVCGGFPNTKSAKNGIRQSDGENVNCYGKGIGIKAGMNNGEYGDSGSASRYFYCAKASKKDRDEGLDKFDSEKAQHKNTHPTVKPTELMQYLIRLVTPNGGVILDPFMGSGSTGKAVVYENRERNKNFDFIGIEKEEEYYNIAKARIENI